MWRRRAPPARLLGSVAALGLFTIAALAGPLATRAEPLPAASLLPSLPIPSLPLPSLPLPSLPLPSPSLPSPSLPIPSLPLPSLTGQPSISELPAPSILPSVTILQSVLGAPTGSSTPTAPTGGSALPAAASARSGDGGSSTGSSGSPSERSSARPDQHAPGGAGDGPFGPIGLPQLDAAGSAAFLGGLLALYLVASAGWLAVVRQKLGGIGLRVTSWREERLREHHPGA